MEKYNDLNIPRQKAQGEKTIRNIMNDYCHNAVTIDCQSTLCEKCLYEPDNIDKFTDWYKKEEEK